jgi:hypothetical protein
VNNYVSLSPLQLVAFRDELERRRGQGWPPSSWTAMAAEIVRRQRPSATRETAEVLADIMTLVPDPYWVQDYLEPARRGRAMHPQALLDRAPEIRAAQAAGLPLGDRLTRRC